MAKDTKPKVVNYRRCEADAPEGEDPNSFNLQKLLRAARLNFPAEIERKIGDGGRRELLAHFVHKQGCECGTLVLYEKGKKIPLVDVEKDGTTWEAVTPPVDSKGNLRNLKEQALFFAVRGNHVAVIQTRELSVKELERFYTWMIQSEAKLAEGWMFLLQNIPTREAMERIKDRKIKGIKIGKSAFSVSKQKITDEERKVSKTPRKKFRKSIKLDPMVKRLITTFTKDEDLLDELSKSEDPGNIFVELYVSYRSRSEKDSQELMKSFASTVGDQEDLNPQITLDGDSKIAGHLLTIKDKVEVQCPDGNIAADDAMSKLAEWLNESIKSGKVFSC